MELAIEKINAAKLALSQASDIYQILEIRDRAAAMAAYADAKGAAEAANYAKEVQLRAERKAGEFLREMPKNQGVKLGGNTMLPPGNEPTYSDLGIHKMQAQRWQLAADLPEEQFEQIISTAIDTGKELTAKEVLNAAKEYRHKEQREEMAQQIIDIPIEASIITGDFRQIMDGMPANSVDMIFTDPPYDEKSIPLYGDMARLAANVLKPGGSLIAYVGHYAIIEVGKLMAEHLRFWWTIAVKHTGASARLPGKWVYVEWKPMLWFVKGGRNNNNNFVADFIESKPPSKIEHDWQQDITEAEYYINNLTVPGGMVLDPFCGSGTTIIASINLGRQSIGIEIDEERANVARSRVANNSR